MGVPKRKTSKMRLRTRKAANAWKFTGLFVDAKSGNMHHGHCVDLSTGMYRGRQVISKTVEE